MATTVSELLDDVASVSATLTPGGDLAEAWQSLSAKADPYSRLWGYYDGQQPLSYSSRRLKDLFKDLTAVFAENWCAVVVDSVKDRVNLAGVSHADATTDAALQAVWSSSELALGSDDVHESALVIGEGFLLIWPDSAGVPQAYSNDPRLCHAHYSAENPRVMSWAAKRWVGEDDHYYITLYYPDRLEYYRSDKKAADVQAYSSMVPAELPSAPNPYGVVPVFHFRPQRRIIKGELTSVIPLQDAVNKLLADMMVAAEFGAFPQRWIISGMDGDGAASTLPNAPNINWLLPPGDGDGQQTGVGQFAATDLNNYLVAIDNLATAIGTISRTPHHFLAGGAGANVSGEALIALEAPLTKKASDRIDAFSPTWQQAMAFAALLSGVPGVVPEEITLTFDRTETVQPRTSAEITQIRVATGLPIETALRMEGFDEAELELIAEEKAADDQKQSASLGQAMLAAQTAFDRGAASGEDQGQMPVQAPAGGPPARKIRG